MWLFIFTTFLFAKPQAPKQLPKLIQSFEKKWASIQSYQADFLQINFSKSLGSKEESRGTMIVMKPTKMRWESRTDGTLQILNGNRYLNVQENRRRKNRVVDVYNNISKSADLRPLSFLSGSVKISDLYQIKIVSEGPETIEFRLIPKNAKEETLVAEIEKKSYLLRALTSENSESRVRMEFSNIVENPKVDESSFEFRPGPNDVVHEQ